MNDDRLHRIARIIVHTKYKKNDITTTTMQTFFNRFLPKEGADAAGGKKKNRRHSLLNLTTTTTVDFHDSSYRSVPSLRPVSSSEEESSFRESPRRKKLPDHVLIVEEFLEAVSRHDKDVLSFFVSPLCQVHLEDDFSTNAQLYCESLLPDLWKAFPDYQLKYKSIRRAGDDDRRCRVLVEGVTSFGNHTGTAYSIGPDYPPIPAFGRRVKTDEERFLCTFAECGTKLQELTIVSLGVVTGPAGFYEQVLGGRLG